MVLILCIVVERFVGYRYPYQETRRGRSLKLISVDVLGVSWRQPTSISTDWFITGLKKAYKLCKERYDHKLNKKISPLHVGDVLLG